MKYWVTTIPTWHTLNESSCLLSFTLFLRKNCKDSMLLCICSVTGYRWHQNVERTTKKKACKEQLSVIDVLTKVFSDLLLNRPTAIRSLFVLYDKKAKCCQWWHHLCICHAINHKYELIKMHVSFRKFNNFFFPNLQWKTFFLRILQDLIPQGPHRTVVHCVHQAVIWPN